MPNRAARIRALLEAAGGEILERTRYGIKVRLPDGRIRVRQSLGWIHTAQGEEIDTDLDVDETPEPWAVRARAALDYDFRGGDDGTRRYIPRKAFPDEWIEFGRPEARIGGKWRQVTLGSMTRDRNRLIWDQPSYAVEVVLLPHKMKLNFVLKEASANRPFRFPVSLNGLSKDGRYLRGGDGEVACELSAPWWADSSSPEQHDVDWLISGGFVYLDAGDLTEAQYPVVIDPTVAVAAGADDGNGDGGYGYSATTTYLIIGNDGLGGQTVWLRFDGIAADQGATISAATVDFVASHNKSGTTVYTDFFGVEESDHAAPVSSAEWQADHALHTSASVPWDSIAAWTAGTTYTSPDLASLLTEIVGHGDWVSGNAIGIHLDDGGSSASASRYAASYENTSYDPPELDYTVGTPQIQLPLLTTVTLYPPEVVATYAGYATTVNALNPIAYWRLGESSGTTANDETGSYDGTYVNTPTLGTTGLIAGDDDTAVTFAAASSEHVTTGTNVGDFDLADSFTLLAWITPALDSSDDAIIANAYSAAGWELRVTSANKIRFILIEDGGNYKGMDSSVLSGSHFVAAVWNGSAISLYVDGSLDNATPVTGGTVTTITTANPVYIARDPNGNYFDGVLDEVTVFDSALSSDDVADLWTAGNALPVSLPCLSTGVLYPMRVQREERVTLPFLVGTTLYPPTIQVKSRVELPFLETVSLYPPTVEAGSQIDLPFLEPATLYPPTIQQEYRINLPYLEPATLYPPTIRREEQIILPYLAFGTLYPPTVEAGDVQLPFLEFGVLYAPTVRAQGLIKLPYLEPATLYPPTVDRAADVWLPYLTFGTLYPPEIEAADVNLPFLEYGTLYAPTVASSQRIFEFADGPDITIDMGGAHRIEVYVDSTVTSSGLDESLEAATGLPAGWSHVTVTKDGNLFTIFIDGTEDGTGTITISGAAAITEDFRISDSFNGWQGRIAEVALWQRVLPDATIQLIADAALDVFAQETADVRIGKILTIVGFPAGWRDMDTGGFTLEAVSDSGGDALQIIQKAELSEGGIFYQAPDGQVVFHNRAALGANQTLVTTLKDDSTDYAAVMVDYSDEGLYNRARVTVASGALYTADNQNTVTQGVQAIDRTVDLQDSDGQTYANWLAERVGETELRVGEVTINPMGDPTVLWPIVLGADLFNRVGLQRYYSDANPIDLTDLVVEGVTVAWTPGQWTHVWRTSSVDHGQWDLGTSVLGEGTYLT